MSQQPPAHTPPTSRPVADVAAERTRESPVAIIDIGSNSIRLVVYEGLSRTPMPVFNEKAVCALGQGLEASGRLNPEGVPLALAVVGRFVALARAMAVVSLDVLATAAVRDAADGAAFVAAIEAHNRVAVQVLSGGEEARLAALGVLCSVPDADGVVADLGGGSLELVEVSGGTPGRHITSPLGVLRLAEASGGDRTRAAGLIDAKLDGIDWLAEARGRPLYAVGGAWRSIARICIAQTAHPLMVLDNFTLQRDEALAIVDLISRQSKKSLEKIPGLSKKRIPHLPMAALLLEKVIQAAMPARLVFSVYGMREGQFFKRLPAELQWQDPLIAACTVMARETGRFSEHGDELLVWMAPLFHGETAGQGRLRYAACLLSDAFWHEHPDYRGEQAFFRVLRLPFMGLEHRERAALALTVHARYGSGDEDPHVAAARQLLSEEEVRRARVVGLALRLGHTLSGGAPGVLSRTKLVQEGNTLVLEVPAGDPLFVPELMDKRFDRLAKSVGCEALSMRRMG